MLGLYVLAGYVGLAIGFVAFASVVVSRHVAANMRRYREENDAWLAGELAQATREMRTPRPVPSRSMAGKRVDQ